MVWPYIGVALYQWTCTDPNSAEEPAEYIIPNVSADLLEDGILVTETVGAQLNIYHLPSDLNSACYGRVVAIKYCYQFDMTIGRPAVFNWTLLILEGNDDNSGFNITDIITIENCDLENVNCAGQAHQLRCCDEMEVSEFDLPLIFGVTESDHGSTHGATLLGFHHSKSEYLVDTVRVSKGGLPLTIGSVVPNTPEVQDGLRMLWFIIVGKLILSTIIISHGTVHIHLQLSLQVQDLVHVQGLTHK